MSRDPLNDIQPHTARRGKLPDFRPTCSKQTEDNRGCDQYRTCSFTTEKEKMVGPFQVVVEDYRDCKPGDGRRTCVWCFNYNRQYFDRNKESENFGNMKPGYALCEDRVYAELETTEVAPAEYAPDGRLSKPPQFRNDYKPARLKEYDKQGPYHWPAESAAPKGALDAIRKGQAAAEPAGAPAK